MIGIFDSGIGGLTVLKEIKKLLPLYDLVYFGDTARVPYGNKSANLIKQYAKTDADFLLKMGAKIIIVACNTVSAVALDDLRKNFTIPIFGVIQPALQAALQATKSGKIGVIGTRATVNSGAFTKELKVLNLNTEEDKSIATINVPAFVRRQQKIKKTTNKKIKIFYQSAPLLVPLIEENYIYKSEAIKIVKQYLQPLKKEQIDTLILGCTHYPIIYDLIATKLKNVKIINPAVRVAHELQDFLLNNPEIDRSMAKRKQVRYFVSDLTTNLSEVAQNFMGKNINLEPAEID